MTEHVQEQVAPDDAGSHPISVDEANARFLGEWVLMQVTKFDEVHDPCEGYILAHSPDRKDISIELAKQPPRSELPPDVGPFYIFRAARLSRSGPEYEQALIALAEDIRASLEAGRAIRRR